MQRRVLLGAGAVVLAAAGYMALRGTARHEATHAVDQGLDQLVARLPPGYAIRHGATEASPLNGTLTVNDVVVTRNGTTLWTADAVTVSGADGQALQDVFDPAAYPDGKPKWSERRLLLADLNLRGVHYTEAGDAKDGFSIESVKLHRLSGRPFMLPPTDENRARPGWQADAALALAADGVMLHDFRAEMPPGPKAVKFGFGTFRIVNYDSGRMQSAAIGDALVDITGRPGPQTARFTMGDLDVGGVDVRHVLETIRTTGRSEPKAFTKVSYATLNGHDIAMQLKAGPGITLHDLHMEQEPLRGGTGYLHGMVFDWSKPSAPQVTPAWLQAFGMNSITLDIETASRMAADKSAMLHEDIVLHDLGTFHLDGAFSGYDAAMASPDNAYAALQATTLEKASLVLEDHSLVNRLFAVAAAQMHATPDVVRAQLAMPLVTLGLMLPEQPDAADQLTNFLSHPGTLTVTMNPPQKITLGEVARAPVTARAQMLGVHIAAK